MIEYDKFSKDIFEKYLEQIDESLNIEILNDNFHINSVFKDREIDMCSKIFLDFNLETCKTFLSEYL